MYWNENRCLGCGDQIWGTQFYRTWDSNSIGITPNYEVGHCGTDYRSGPYCYSCFYGVVYDLFAPLTPPPSKFDIKYFHKQYPSNSKLMTLLGKLCEIKDELIGKN